MDTCDFWMAKGGRAEDESARSSLYTNVWHPEEIEWNKGGMNSSTERKDTRDYVGKQNKHKHRIMRGLRTWLHCNPLLTFESFCPNVVFLRLFIVQPRSRLLLVRVPPHPQQPGGTQLLASQGRTQQDRLPHQAAAAAAGHEDEDVLIARAGAAAA